MSKVKNYINVTILLISFNLLPNAAQTNDLSFLIKICYKKHYAHCLGTYIRPNYILATDLCTWYVNNLLHRDAYLVGGDAKDASCDAGEKIKIEKHYSDSQTLRDEYFRKISLIKVNKPFEMDSNLQLGDVTLAYEGSFKQRKIKKCNVYAYKHNEGTLNAFSVKVANKGLCNITFGSLPNVDKFECLKIEELINVINSPVVCNGVIEGFIVQIKDNLAAFIKTATQGNWISIIADGKTLKVAMTSASSTLTKLNLILFLCFIILYVINNNI